MDFEGLIVKALKMSACLLVFFCLAMVLEPQNLVVRGLVVGTAVGIWNTFFLARRLSAVGRIPAEEAKARMMGGMAVRVLSMYAVLLLAALTGWFNICASAAGLFVVHCLFTFSAAGVLLKEAGITGKSRHEKSNAKFLI
jgi:hypothetical protein